MFLLFGLLWLRLLLVKSISLLPKKVSKLLVWAVKIGLVYIFLLEVRFRLFDIVDPLEFIFTKFSLTSIELLLFETSSWFLSTSSKLKLLGWLFWTKYVFSWLS